MKLSLHKDVFDSPTPLSEKKDLGMHLKEFTQLLLVEFFATTKFSVYFNNTNLMFLLKTT
jgi:hypothetical protein